MKHDVNDEKMLKFAEFLRNLRYEKGYTLHDVKKATKISISDINQMENGLRKKINPFHLIELSNIYNINVLKFYEMLGYVSKEDIENAVDTDAIKERVNEILDEKENRYSTIPLFSSVAAGAGNIVEDTPEAFIQVPFNNSYNYRAAYVDGDSMEPTLFDNGIVIFDPDIRTLKSGDIGVFKLNDHYYVKRFYQTQDGIVLQSDNHLYFPILVKKHDDFYIWGKCLGTINHL